MQAVDVSNTVTAGYRHRMRAPAIQVRITSRWVSGLVAAAGAVAGGFAGGVISWLVWMLALRPALAPGHTIRRRVMTAAAGLATGLTVHGVVLSFYVSILSN